MSNPATIKIDVPVVKQKQHGYYTLAEVPQEDALSAYYESHYYDPLRRAPMHEDAEQVQRDLIAQSENLAREERDWRDAAEYEDICAHLAELCGAPSAHVLDIGAGIGELVGSLKARGFETTGIEPSKEACLYGQSQGLNIVEHSLASWVEHTQTNALPKADAITMLNVLEHVPDPEQALRHCNSLLGDGGVVCIRVPNDFSAVQDAVIRKTGGPRWWVVSPDHINYFSRDSLTSLLASCGFTVELSSCDFPIDWFLLMGDNYLESPELGADCHRRRKAFELSLPGPVRRKLYQSLSEAGFGRNLVLYARKT